VASKLRILETANRMTVDVASYQECTEEEEELVAIRRRSLPNQRLAAQTRRPDEEWQGRRRCHIISGACPLAAWPHHRPANQRRCRCAAGSVTYYTVPLPLQRLPGSPVPGFFRCRGRAEASGANHILHQRFTNGAITAPAHTMTGSRLAMHV
jgi:hypothetical protein